jgi:ferredoxin-NADP reductase
VYSIARRLKVVNAYFSKSSTKWCFLNLSKLKAGDVLEVGTPEGSLRSLPMQIAKKITPPLYLEAESPVLSILKSVLKSEPKSTFVLVYGNKTPEDTIFINNYTTYYNT